MESAIVGMFLLIVIFWVVVSTVLGGIIGSRKGRTGAGVALGLLLGWVGVVIIAVMKPSPEAEAQKAAAQAQVLRDALGGGASGALGVSPAVVITAQVRQDLMAEAIRRDPSLADSSNPETLTRLGETVAELEKEYILKTELQQLKDSQEAAERAAEQAVRNAQAAEERAAIAAAAAEADRRAAAAAAEERSARIEKMSPPLRWAFQHPAPSLTILGVLALIMVASVITVGNNISSRNAENAAAEAAAAAAADREAEFATLAASCDVELAKDVKSADPVLLSALAECSDATVQMAVAANPLTPMATLEKLAEEGLPEVRARLAAASKVPISIQTLLAADNDEAVRQAVARNTGTDIGLLSRLLSDSSSAVRSEAVANISLSSDLLTGVVQDPSPEVRLSALVRRNDLPIDLVLQMTRDSDPEVAERAGSNILFSRDDEFSSAQKAATRKLMVKVCNTDKMKASVTNMCEYLLDQ